MRNGGRTRQDLRQQRSPPHLAEAARFTRSMGRFGQARGPPNQPTLKIFCPASRPARSRMVVPELAAIDFLVWRG